MSEVSVIIPVYNVEPYLRECIDSVLAQTFQNIEIILVDDGATDHCPDICDEYADHYPNVSVIHQRNGGLSTARNAGMAAAKGTYIYFLDSDDYIVPHAIETLYDIAEQKNADAVFFEAFVIDESSRPIFHARYSYFYQRTAEYSECKPGKVLFAEMLHNGDYLPTVQLVFLRRSSIHVSFTPILHEDELFTPQLLYSIDRACTCSSALFARRIRSGSITNEKKTYRHYAGMSAAARGLLAIPSRDSALDRRVSQLTISAASIHCRLDRQNKRMARPERCLLVKTLLSQNNRLGTICAVVTLMDMFYPLFNALMYHLQKASFSLVAKLRDRKRYRPVLQKLQHASSEKKRVFLIGSPEHGNLGDHAIAQAELQFFSVHVPLNKTYDISMPFYMAYRRAIGKLVRQSDMVAISGGGWLGNVWYHNEKAVLDVVKRFNKNRIVIFPQTIWYQNINAARTIHQMRYAKRVYTSHSNLTLCVREPASFALAKTLCKNVLHVPDMCLYLDKRQPSKRQDILLCFRRDSEITLSARFIRQIEDTLISRGVSFRYTTTVLEKSVPLQLRNAALNKKFAEFSGARLVITDQLYPALFSVVTGTSCIVIDNLAQEVSGMKKLLGHDTTIHFAANDESAIREINTILKSSMNAAAASLEQHFIPIFSLFDF